MGTFGAAEQKCVQHDEPARHRSDSEEIHNCVRSRRTCLESESHIPRRNVYDSARCHQKRRSAMMPVFGYVALAFYGHMHVQSVDSFAGNPSSQNNLAPPLQQNFRHSTSGKSILPDVRADLWLRPKSSYKQKDLTVVTERPLGDGKDIMDEIVFSAEETTNEWSEHVGQRYTDIVPPKGKVSQMKLSVDSLMPFSSTGEHCSKSVHTKQPPVLDTDYVLLLDLDKCSFFGNDINDLGICLQWMGLPQEEVVHLYRLLLSPCVAETFEALKERHKQLRVVIYTARATLINYRSAFRTDKVIPVAWNPKWMDNGQVYFPPHMATAADIMASSAAGLEEMVQDERDDLQKALERLLAARQVIQEALGLPASPEVVVTATPKEVDSTVRRLGYTPGRACLWDDNERLRGAPGVVTVPPFVRLPAAQRAAALAFLNARVPPARLEPDLVEFMLGADPGDCALAHAADGTLEYRLAEAPTDLPVPEPWPLPVMTPGTAAAAAAADDWEDCVSSVTPENEAHLRAAPPAAGQASGRAGGGSTAQACGGGLHRVPTGRQSPAECGRAVR